MDIFDSYCKGDSPVAGMLTVYIEEAHSRDEWYLPDASNAEVSSTIYTHQCIQDRLDAASRFINDNRFPIEMVCDTMEGNVVDRYGGWPERLYIVLDGVIVYQGGIGPFGYDLSEVRAWLDNYTPQ